MHKLPVHLIPPTTLPNAKTIEKDVQLRVIQLSSRLLFQSAPSCHVSVLYPRWPLCWQLRAEPAGKGHTSGWVLALIYFWALHLELDYFIRVRAVMWAKLKKSPNVYNGCRVCYLGPVLLPDDFQIKIFHRVFTESRHKFPDFSRISPY